MEIEGPLAVERRPTRRWVTAVAIVVPVVIPVVIFVGLTAWFIRTFVAPPMVAIPSPMVLAAAPAAPPAKVQVEATALELPNPVPAAEPTARPPAAEPSVRPPAAEAPEPTPALPMFASLAAAPPTPTVGVPPAAFADRALDRSTTMMMMTEPSTLEPGKPIAGPIPMPRPKPRISVALVTEPVPLPRARPIEDSPAPEILPVDRHGVD
jgi:hypothetical protein